MVVFFDEDRIRWSPMAKPIVGPWSTQQGDLDGTFRWPEQSSEEALKLIAGCGFGELDFLAKALKVDETWAKHLQIL